MTSSPEASAPLAQVCTSQAVGGVSWWERLSFWSAHALVSTLLVCVSLSGLYRLGRVFGTLEWLINHGRRRRFATALERIYGERPQARERRRATREFFMQSRCDKLFYLAFDRIPHDTAASLLTIENKSLLDEALARGRGTYMAMSHHGPHHVAAMLMTLLGYKVAGVRDKREGGLRRYVQDRFDRLHPEFRRMRVLFSDSYPRDIYRCFRDGYLLGSAMDVSRLRRQNQKAAEVTIFGERRMFLTGPLRVALRCGTPVLQTFIVPEKAFRYRLDVVAVLIDPAQVENEDSAIAGAMQTYAANVESYVRQRPALLSRL